MILLFTKEVGKIYEDRHVNRVICISLYKAATFIECFLFVQAGLRELIGCLLRYTNHGKFRQESTSLIIISR